MYEIDVSSDLRALRAGLRKELLTEAFYLAGSLYLTTKVKVF
jgi:hypothetical protein